MSSISSAIFDTAESAWVGRWCSGVAVVPLGRFLSIRYLLGQSDFYFVGEDWPLLIGTDFSYEIVRKRGIRY